MILALLLLIGTVEASPVKTFWSDSYDAGDGICRCDSTYDHGIDTTIVETPCGNKTVPEVCALILEKYGVGPMGNRTYYNSTQCGHQPYNNVIDETVCPGIPEDDSVRPFGDWSGPRCMETGSLWPLEGICETESAIDCTSSSWTGGGGLNFVARCIGVEQPKANTATWLLLLYMGVAALSLITVTQSKWYRS